MDGSRTPAAKKAKELAKYLRQERPDYNYLKSVWRHLRTELEIEVPKAERNSPMSPRKKKFNATTKRSGRLRMYRTWF